MENNKNLKGNKILGFLKKLVRVETLVIVLILMVSFCIYQNQTRTITPERCNLALETSKGQYAQLFAEKCVVYYVAEEQKFMYSDKLSKENIEIIKQDLQGITIKE